jgi:hypothetical protein
LRGAVGFSASSSVNVLLPYPQLGADIDRPEDLEAARRLKSQG